MTSTHIPGLGMGPGPSGKAADVAAPSMNYYIPQWEERTSYGFRRIDPYGKLFEDRIIFLGTPISDDIANAVMAQLLCLESMDPDRDRWFTAEQAKEYGFIDNVISSARQVADEGRPARNK